MKLTIPGASHRSISPVSFWPKGPKTEILYFTPPEIAKRQFRPPPRGGKFGNPEAEPSGNYLDEIVMVQEALALTLNWVSHPSDALLPKTLIDLNRITFFRFLEIPTL